MNSAQSFLSPENEVDDEFDVDIAISVLPDLDEAGLSFSTWWSCKGTCNTCTSVTTCC